MKKPHVYEQTYTDYLSRIAELDFPFLADKLGIQLDGQHVIIPFFGKPYRISAKGITDPSNRQPHLSVSVILCKYQRKSVMHIGHIQHNSDCHI